MTSDSGDVQVFTVTVSWSPESDGRVTEGDVQEAIEQLVLEIDEEATVDVAEQFGH